MTEQEYIKLGLDLVEKHLGKIVNFLTDFGSEKRKEFLARTKKSFSEYIANGVGKYSKIKTVLYRDVPVFLYDFYVNVSLTCARSVISTDRVENIFADNKFVIITGGAGSGKSTLLKHLFLNALRTSDLIPIFVELRNINITETTFHEFLYKSVENLGYSLEERYFLKSLENGGFLFLLDGFDEIESEKRRVITNSVIEFSDRYNKNYFVVSSRPDSGFISWNRYTEMQVLPLTLDQAISMIDNIDYEEEAKKIFMTEIRNGLFEKHKSFASNPLLLTIMLMTFNQFAKIPEKMHIFYEQAFDTLYNKHDATKNGYIRKMYTSLAKDDFENIVSCFSFLSYINSDVSFSSEKMRKYFLETKKLLRIEFDENDFIKDLIESVCLILQDGLIYTYSHRTFQEYFAVLFMLTLNDDVLKKVLFQLVHRAGDDSTMDLLFEIDRMKIEQFLIIPLLGRLETALNYSQEKIESIFMEYLVLAYDEMGIDMDNENNARVYFRFVRKGWGEKYRSVVEFVYKRYGEIYPFKNFDSRKYISNSKQIAQKYLRYGEKKVSFKIDELYQNRELYYDVLENAQYIVDMLNFAMKVLDQLRVELSDQKESIIKIILNG